VKLNTNWSTVEGIKSHCRVQPNGCWVWLGGGCDGTPKIRAFDPKIGEKRAMSGPRAMWLAAYGREARNRAFRACPTPRCLNPLHLREVRTQRELMGYLGRVDRYKGTFVEQRAAAAAKGRAVQGKADTPRETVLAIWHAPKSTSHRELARVYGCDSRTVGAIRHGQIYRYITGAPDPAPLG
jgi:hypothetical protein